MKQILDNFNSYTEAYLEYINNFVTPTKFREYYDISEEDFVRLVHARSMIESDRSWRYIDFFYNIFAQLDKLTNGYGEPAEYDVQLMRVKTRQSWLATFLKQHGWKVTSTGEGCYFLKCK